jgi:hypothetical protein
MPKAATPAKKFGQETKETKPWVDEGEPAPVRAPEATQEEIPF